MLRPHLRATADARPPDSLHNTETSGPNRGDNEKCLSILEDLLEQYALQMNRESVQAADILERLESNLEMGLYSTAVLDKNRVQVYDTVLALPKEYRVVFVGGLSQDQFPLMHTESPVLKDDACPSCVPCADT